jgi:hypothetical protein
MNAALEPSTPSKDVPALVPPSAPAASELEEH